MTPIELQGQARSYVVDFTAFHAIERSTGRSYPAALLSVLANPPRILDIVQFFQGALADPADVSLEDAANIMDDIGGVDIVARGVSALLDAGPAVRPILEAAAASQDRAEDFIYLLTRRLSRNLH